MSREAVILLVFATVLWLFIFFLFGLAVGADGTPRGFTCTARVVETGQCTAYVRVA